MSIIHDYWSKWLAGKTTDNEVDAYIRSSFAHLVSEYRSVYFLKCVCRENPSATYIDTSEATDFEEWNQNQEQIQGAGNSQESAAVYQSESTQQSDTGDAIAVIEQNQDLSRNLEQLQITASPQENETGSQSESTQQSDTGDTTAAEEQNQDQEQAKGAPAVEPNLSDYACRQSPELRALLDGFDKGDFNEGNNNLSWADCALLEVSIIRLLDRDRLKTKLAMLEDKYEAVVEPKNTNAINSL